MWASYIDEPVLRVDSSGTKLYYHRNQQYSIVALTNSLGGIVERYAYSAYGELTILSGSGSPQSFATHQNRYQYTGREWDEKLELYHYRARMHNPVAGRFVSRDPIRFLSRRFNFYEYVRCSPVRFVDPLGLSDVVPGGEMPRDHDGGNVFCEWSEMESFICDRNGYGKYDFPYSQIKTGCIGITAALIGHYPRFSQGDFRYCFDKLDQAIGMKQNLQASGYCKGKDSCGNPSNPVIFAFTWNRKKSLVDYPVKTPLEFCTCGHVIWNDEQPRRCWIWDFGFYLEGPGVFCHASQSQGSGGKPEISTCFGFELYERKHAGHETIYCVTCEGDGKDGFTQPTVPQR